MLRENLIVSWSPQKRWDRVDRLLVGKHYAEEEAWTNFT